MTTQLLALEPEWAAVADMTAGLLTELRSLQAPDLYRLHVFTPETQREQRAHALYVALATERARWVIPLGIGELIHSPGEVAGVLAFADSAKASVVYCHNEARRFRVFAVRTDRTPRTLESGLTVLPATTAIYTDMVAIVGQAPTFAEPTPGIEGAAALYGATAFWMDGSVPQELWRHDSDVPVAVIVVGTMNTGVKWRRIAVKRVK